jgi:hypothetical protein
MKFGTGRSTPKEATSILVIIYLVLASHEVRFGMLQHSKKSFTENNLIGDLRYTAS